MYRQFFKRIIDVLVALVGLVVSLPITLPVLLLLAIANSGKPFFFQKRPGKNARIFSIVKFKTMNDKKGADGALLPDDKRLTAVGAFVRKTSLDEIPQLINVIKGEMSLIGPRPLLVEYLPMYNEEQRRRHEIRPGITGWAQVNGRNTVSWHDKFKLDIWYIEHLSFKLDMRIIYLTLLKVIKSEGIMAAGSATVEKFKGNE